MPNARAYKYRLRPPQDWGEDCEQEMRLQNRLWNALVEVSHKERQLFHAILGQNPDYARLQQQTKTADDAIEVIKQSRRTERQRVRSAAETPEVDDGLAQSIVRIRQLRAEMKALSKPLRQEYAAQINQLQDAVKASVKLLRNQSGLWWGNYNAVCASWTTMRQQTMKKGLLPRFHRYDGQGRLTNQIQGGLTAERLVNAASAQLALHRPPDTAFDPTASRGARRQAARQAALTITVFSSREGGRRTVTFPMVMHRDLPADALIKQVVVKRTRQGLDWQWHAIFTVVDDQASARHRHPTRRAGIDLGWRLVPGGLRVATIAASDRSRAQTLVLPKAILDGFAYCERLQAELDAALNELLPSITGLPLGTDDLELTARFEQIRKAPRIGAAKLAYFALILRDWPDGNPEIKDRLEAWRSADKRKRQEMLHLRAKLRARRNELYRTSAAALASAYGVIAVEDVNWADAARLETYAGERNVLPLPARHYRVLANIAALKDWLAKQADKRGGIIVRGAGGTTSTCHACGHENHPVQPEAIIWRCEGCGETWDQDENAAFNILSFAKEQAA